MNRPKQGGDGIVIGLPAEPVKSMSFNLKEPEQTGAVHVTLETSRHNAAALRSYHQMCIALTVNACISFQILGAMGKRFAVGVFCSKASLVRYLYRKCQKLPLAGRRQSQHCYKCRSQDKVLLSVFPKLFLPYDLQQQSSADNVMCFSLFTFFLKQLLVIIVVTVMLIHMHEFLATVLAPFSSILH